MINVEITRTKKKKQKKRMYFEKALGVLLGLTEIAITRF